MQFFSKVPNLSLMNAFLFLQYKINDSKKEALGDGKERMEEKNYLCIDLKSFYASCECIEICLALLIPYKKPSSN